MSVSVSGDTALVGADRDTVGANMYQGSAYVYVRSGTAWVQQAHLTASDGAAQDYFGSSVSVSGDAALVGAIFDDVGANIGQGSAYVYVRSGTMWSEQGHVTASDGVPGELFGNSVSVSGDTALVGAIFDDVGANIGQGSAYVYVRSGTTWSEQGHLAASDGAAQDYFGSSVSVSGDTALVGAPYDDVGANVNQNQGSAYVYVRSGTTWAQQGKLTASDGVPGDVFGWSVSVSGDTALVGAYGANNLRGSAYVYVRSGTTWAEQGHLTASDGVAQDFFGRSVFVSGDTALVGAEGDTVGANRNQGSAYVYVRSGTTWSEQGHLTANGGATGAQFGNSVSVSGDTALVGAEGDTVGANSAQGSAYVYVRSGTTWAQQGHLTASDGAANDGFGMSVSVSGDTALVGTAQDAVGANAYQGSAYVYVRSGTAWVEQAHLTASDGAANDGFGMSVSMSGDTALAGAPNKAVGANDRQGSVYAFRLRGTVGYKCGASTDCADNYACVDGVCCTSACAGSCDVCSAVLGAVSDGHCTPIPAGTPGTPACPGNVLCDGSSNACPAGCTTDSQCPSGLRCVDGGCAAVSDNGANCVTKTDCYSRNCVDGVCCDRACTGECEACTVALKGYGVDGVCKPIGAGLDPESECPAEVPASCGYTGKCDGSKAECAAYPGGTDCGATPGLTSCVGNKVVGKVCTDFRLCQDNSAGLDCAPQKCVNGACAPCVTAADCLDPNASYCDSTGRCQPRKVQGASCAASAQCLSTFCVDGVCCAEVCDKGCEWCGDPNAPGVCEAAPKGPPKSGRPACSGTGSCGAQCDGTKRDGCVYPGSATTCGAAKCQGDWVISAGTCDSSGGCTPGTLQDCGNYSCASPAGACKTSCTTKLDCRLGAVCDTSGSTGTCNASGAACQGAYNVKASDGTVSSCNGYRCVSGACQQQCGSNTDCGTGYVCAGSSCVAGTADGGTASGGASGSGGAASTGGASATGGATSVGGSSATGGAAGAGGASGRDSGIASGGALASTGGGTGTGGTTAPDAGKAMTSRDGGAKAAGAASGDTGACGCRVPKGGGGRGTPVGAAGLALGLAVLGRRVRRGRRTRLVSSGASK
jgi:hypothetical protein